MNDTTVPTGAAPSSSTPSSSSSGAVSSTTSAKSAFASKILTAHQGLQGTSSPAPVDGGGKADSRTAETPVNQDQKQPGAVVAEPVKPGEKAPAVVEYQGRRFDFSDTQKVAKRLVDLETGMRGAFKERDQLKAQLAQHAENAPQLEAGQKFSQIQRKYEIAVRNAMNEDGTVRNARALSAGLDAFLQDLVPAQTLNEWLNHKLQLNMSLMNMSPQDREAFIRDYQDRQDVEAQRIQLELDRGEIDQFKTAKQQAEEARDREAFKAIINPVRQKHSFANTVKDPRTAAFLDKQLWFEAKAQLKELAQQGRDIADPALVDQIFSGIKKELTLGQEGAAREAVGQEMRKAKEGAMSGILDAATSGAAPHDDIAEMQKNGARPGDVLKARFANIAGKFR